MVLPSAPIDQTVGCGGNNGRHLSRCRAGCDRLGEPGVQTRAMRDELTELDYAERFTGRKATERSPTGSPTVVEKVTISRRL